jgi:L-cysteine:1D-myo-inositol 2-amino-2-deoxy-alpha-D-glucopyranoside ligase
MVGLDGTKMSKSLGNLVFVGDLLKEWEPMAVRLALLGHHYRSDWDWHHRDLELAAQRLERWRGAGTTNELSAAALGAVRARLDDDLNARDALVLLDDEAAAGRAVGRGAALMGVEL